MKKEDTVLKYDHEEQLFEGGERVKTTAHNAKVLVTAPTLLLEL